ncbi:MAG: OmpH family outer membrane protein [Bacteroidales bacterium]|nr:OmpH family outer membrane protein [Candidatus Cryptobacteroides caccocaballi]
MKKASLLLSIAALAVAFVSCNQQPSQTASEPAASTGAAVAGSIAYIQLDDILEQYDMANDLRAIVETKVNNIQNEINRRGKKLESDVNSYAEKVQKGLMTRSVAEAQQAKLQQQEQEFNAYANQKQNEINEEQIVMMNQISDAIKTYIDSYNAQKGYAMILVNQAGVPVIAADASLDITQEILDGLNAEYVKSKNTKSAE